MINLIKLKEIVVLLLAIFVFIPVLIYEKTLAKYVRQNDYAAGGELE